MGREASLRRRIVFACVSLTLVLCLVYGVAFWFGVGMIEDKLLNDRIVQASGALIKNHVEHATRDVPGDPKVYQDEEIPVSMRALSPGLHELALEGQVFHVLVRMWNGHRFALVDDESEFERAEGLMWAGLIAASTLCVALALALGATTASRVIQPVVELAEAVKEKRLTRDVPAMALQDEVGTLARALVAHHEEMQRFLAREQLFTGDVSHELRTPLTVMLGASEVLASRLADRADLLPVVERIRRNAMETAGRVAALLLLSRAPESLEFPRVELAPLLRQELDRCAPVLEGKPVRAQLQIDDDAHGYGRPELISMALGNLIRNACEFTDEGWVKVTLQKDRVLIEDSGSGIPDTLRDQVFERFVHRSDRAPGSGLGLAIVQRICVHLGWAVRLDDPDEPGRAGTRFIVVFAAAPPSA